MGERPAEVTIEELVRPEVHKLLKRAGLEIVLRAVVEWAEDRGMDKVLAAHLRMSFESYLYRYGKNRRRQLRLAHGCSSYHRKHVEASEVCGCFYCCRIFEPKLIVEWIDSGQTALCPVCGIDSVLPTALNPVFGHLWFLRAMEKRWFQTPCAIDAGTLQVIEVKDLEDDDACDPDDGCPDCGECRLCENCECGED